LNELERLKTGLEKTRAVDTTLIQSEMDVLRKKVTAIESSAPKSGGQGKSREEPLISRDLASARSDIESLRIKIAELERKKPPAPERGPSLKFGELDSLLGRVGRLEAQLEASSSKKAVPQADFKPDIARLEAKIASLERASLERSPAAGKKVAGQPTARDSQISAAMERLKDDFSSQIASIRAEVRDNNARLSAAARTKPKPGSSVAPGILKKIEELEDSVSQIESIKAKLEKNKAEIQYLIEETGRIDILKKQPLGNIPERLSVLEKRMDERVQHEYSDHHGDDEALEELRNEIRILQASVSGVAVSEKSPDGMEKQEAQAGRIDSMANEVSSLKSRMERLQRDISVLKEAGESSKDDGRPEKQMPPEEILAMRTRMNDIEAKLEKAGKLAAGLRPISIPEEDRSEEKKETERRISSLEGVVGEGVNPKRIKEIEDRIADLKSSLPEKIGKGTDQQLKVLKDKMEEKLRQLENLKRDVIESAIDSLMAQPNALNKFLDERVSRQLKELSEKVEIVEKRMGPVDAKITKVVRDLEGSDVSGVMKDIEILKTKFDWLESTVQKFDLKPLYEKLMELEERSKYSSSYSPMVIE